MRTSAPAETWVNELRSDLRSATADLHEQLDQHALLAPLTTSVATMTQYQTALLALHAVTGPTEDRIGRYLSNHSPPMGYALRRRAPLLLDDLAFLGVTPRRPTWGGPSVASDGALIGSLYVLEGAAIGGRLIYRRMSEVLGVDDERGGRFFYGNGRQTKTLWREFWSFAAGCSSPAQLPKARTAARSLFRSYLTLLDRFQAR